MTSRTLMVQGTASSVGKSVIVTALCRILRDSGFRVAPFKAQNMSNNSYVTSDGGEMGRAQVNQAEAAGVEPETDMNPILLKPESDHRCQIVVEGKPFRTVEAGEYFQLKRTLWPVVTAAFDRLQQRFDAIVIEGAGSPAEINLRDRDIVNMQMAHYARAPVVLVGDIDRGGVFAHLIGTLALLSPEDRGRVQALLINKFRGDAALLQPGLDTLRELSGIPLAGVVPFLPDIGVAEEDAVALDESPAAGSGSIGIAVVQLPHISNFDDFDALLAEPDITVRFVASVQKLGRPDLVILPGTKATVSDLAWLRRSGIAAAIMRLRNEGASVIGVCGGHQMLGDEILDPGQVESTVERTPGLGLLPGTTYFVAEKTTHQVEGHVRGGHGLLNGAAGLLLRGYEIHMGRSVLQGAAPFRIERRSHRACAVDDGSISDDGRVLGTYIHGLFANAALRTAILANLKGGGLPRGTTDQTIDRYDALAARVRPALDLDLIQRLLDTSALPAAGTGLG